MDAGSPYRHRTTPVTRTRKQRNLPESEMSHNYRKPAVRHSYCSVPQKPSSDMLCFLFFMQHKGSEVPEPTSSLEVRHHMQVSTVSWVSTLARPLHELSGRYQAQSLPMMSTGCGWYGDGTGLVPENHCPTASAEWLVISLGFGACTSQFIYC